DPRRDLPGTADDEPRRHDLDARGRAVAVEPAEQGLRGQPADRDRILGDDSDARIEEVGERKVVEPDERDIELAALTSECRERADSEDVLGGEDRRWRARQAKELLDRGLRGVDASQITTDDRLIARQAGSLEGLEVAGMALRRG